MRVRRDYRGWDPTDPLDPEAESVLVFLERLPAGGWLRDVGHLEACIDEHGVVSAQVSLGDARELYLQAGDGWDRVLWTCPSGRTHEWTWRERETPADLRALLGGRGVERKALLRRRRVGLRLVVDGRTLATTEGKLRLALLRRLGIRLSEKDEPAL